MDKIENFRRVIKQILDEHVRIPYPYGELERLAIWDEEQDSYMLVDVGWERGRRIHQVVFHLRIREDKIWVEDDWTEYGVAQELVDAGVAKEEIVLGFQPVEKRPFTEYAVG